MMTNPTIPPSSSTRTTSFDLRSAVVVDTPEMADALNRRLHDETIGIDGPTVTGVPGHRIGVGDLIVSPRNEPGIGVFDPKDSGRAVDSGGAYIANQTALMTPT